MWSLAFEKLLKWVQQSSQLCRLLYNCPEKGERGTETIFRIIYFKISPDLSLPTENIQMSRWKQEHLGSVLVVFVWSNLALHPIGRKDLKYIIIDR